MVLPGHKDDSIRLLYWMKDTLPKGGFLISLMSQYTPSTAAPIIRRLTAGSLHTNMKSAEHSYRIGTDGPIHAGKKQCKRRIYAPI